MKAGASQTACTRGLIYMSASRTKKERQAQNALGLSEKEKKAQAEAKKSRRNVIIYSIIGAVAAIAVILLLVWDSNVIQKHSTAVTIGDEKYGVVDLDYYYFSTYSTYLSNASAFGIDTSVPLDEQEIYEGYTWDAMLKDTALDYLTNVSILVQQAKAEGYELSQAGEDSLTEATINVSSYAMLYGVTEEYYLQLNYGKYMTMEDYERIYRDYLLSQEYANYKATGFEVTDQEIDDFYAQSPVTYDTYDYYCYLVTFDRTSTDEEGNRVDLDEATIEANRAEAEARANEILDALNAGDTDKAASLAEEYGATDNTNLSAVSSSGYADWMNDASTQAGSSAVVENVSAVSGDPIGYFAIYVNDRYLDEYEGANIRVIATPATKDDDGNYLMDECAANAESIVERFEATNKTSEDFAAICDEISSDSDTYPGGLRENVSKKAYNEEITAWLFDSARKQGDYEVFLDETNGCSYVIYYEGTYGTPYWRTSAATSIQSNKYNDWLNALSEEYTPVTGSGFRFVG